MIGKRKWQAMVAENEDLRARLAKVEEERNVQNDLRQTAEDSADEARAEVTRLTAELTIARRAAAPMGCVCPPTSEIMCGAPLCPRKALQGFSVMAAVIDKGATP